MLQNEKRRPRVVPQEILITGLLENDPAIICRELEEVGGK